MCNEERRCAYENSWAMVQEAFHNGFMVSESCLQAALYTALQDNLPLAVHIVAEPRWTVAGQTRYPDLILIEDNEITDIFELKFTPQGACVWTMDFIKLHAYVRGEPLYPARLDPQTGQWTDSLPVRDDCRLHFVAVARYDALAVWPPLLGGDGIHQWFGRVGGSDKDVWDIHFA